jgi:hypothetical protein
MSKIDYMKVIGALSRVLKMEAVDMKFTDKSTDRLEIIMGAPAMQEKIFHIAITSSTLELSFSKDYFTPKEFEKWRVGFEYELEQAFMRNISIQAGMNTTSRIVTMNL